MTNQKSEWENENETKMVYLTPKYFSLTFSVINKTLFFGVIKATV